MDVLADPGTYCYHGDPPWRAYFRSTIAHNTIELAGQSQSGDGGPFLWLQHASGREIEVRDTGDTLSWTAEHDGYRSLTPPARHRRRVRLDGAARTLEIIDEIEGGSHDVRLAFHLGPEVQAELVPDGSGSTVAILQWPGRTAKGAARLALPAGLRWSLHRGETDPILGWYAEGLGHRSPSCTLLGSGSSHAQSAFVTRLEFRDRAAALNPSFAWSDVSWPGPGAQMVETSDIQPEAG